MIWFSRTNGHPQAKSFELYWFLFQAQCMKRRFLTVHLFYVSCLFFPRRVRRVRVCVRPNGQGANVSECVWVSVRAWGKFFFCLYSSGVRRCVHLSCWLISNVWHSWRSFRSIQHSTSFPSHSSPLLSVLALRPTVNLRVYSCLNLGPETGSLQHV